MVELTAEETTPDEHSILLKLSSADPHTDAVLEHAHSVPPWQSSTITPQVIRSASHVHDRKWVILPALFGDSVSEC
jgi:hypothetical protein